MFLFAPLLEQRLLHVPALLGRPGPETGPFRPVQLRTLLFALRVLLAVLVVVVLRLVRENPQTGQEQVDDAGVNTDASEESTVVGAQGRGVVELAQDFERQCG